MSRRTAEASKAIRKAWENERQLVSEGMGTRDWTPEQQRDICEIGKAYDPSGKAFEGHHMQSAEQHPEYQGDPENIQFLTHSEHFAAHDFNWRQPTNGYYDYVNDVTVGFGAGKYSPCEVIKLSSPIKTPSDAAGASDVGRKSHGEDPTHAENGSGRARQKNPTDFAVLTPEAADSESPNTHTRANAPRVTGRRTLFSRALDTLKDTRAWVKAAAANHPKAVNIVKSLVFTAVVAGIGGAVSRSGGINSDREGDVAMNSSGTGHDFSDTASPDCSIPTARDYPSERSSPREHLVSGYDRHQNGKTVHVSPYKRGKG